MYHFVFLLNQNRISFIGKRIQNIAIMNYDPLHTRCDLWGNRQQTSENIYNPLSNSLGAG